MLVPLTVADVMSEPVEIISPEHSAAEAARRLEEANVGSLVVCENGEPVGIVTESDMVGLIARNANTEVLTVGELMSTDLLTTTPDTTLEEAARMLADHDFRRLPVCVDDELVGIVTTTDLSYYLPHLLRRGGNRQKRIAALESESPSTAYDAPDWAFEHEGDERISVGDTVRFQKTLSEADVQQFAEATGDTNRIHLDAAFAEATMFEGRIAHGILTVGLISAALARLPGLTIYLSQDLRFLGPVGIDETVTAVCEVVEDLGKGKYALATTVYGEDGEVVIDGDAVVLMAEFPDVEAEQPAPQLE